MRLNCVCGCFCVAGRDRDRFRCENRTQKNPSPVKCRPPTKERTTKDQHSGGGVKEETMIVTCMDNRVIHHTHSCEGFKHAKEHRRIVGSRLVVGVFLSCRVLVVVWFDSQLCPHVLVMGV